MISVITLSGDLPRCLFDFLRNRPGDTALGYFKELMHTVSEEFQSNVSCLNNPAGGVLAER